MPSSAAASSPEEGRRSTFSKILPWGGRGGRNRYSGWPLVQARIVRGEDGIRQHRHGLGRGRAAGKVTAQGGEDSSAEGKPTIS